MNEISCQVEECAYNNNKKCTAKNVQVTSCGDMCVETSDGTACQTFVPRQ